MFKVGKHGSAIAAEPAKHAHAPTAEEVGYPLGARSDFVFGFEHST